MAQVWVGRWKRQLAKLVKVKLPVTVAIVLTDDIISVRHARAKVVLAHEVVELGTIDLAIVAPIQVLEKFHGFEIGVSTQVLSFHLDLKEHTQHRCKE